ncbi:gas vesicle protein [Actinacidiphila guanduensis]|uniref:Gas vesicle protein n=1 Tax=Actinacidiphila guanduensis TaxID=310781 RepID=A0A1H0NIS4_9ACTN|nr:Gas vesicle protein [Actinacidiphila guanduensis]
MTQSPAERFDSVPSRATPAYGQGSSANLADILERVLDKGIVIAGDIQINLLDIELLTIKLRLLVASVDKAKEMGIDWWEHDPSLSSRAREDRSRDDRALADENRRLREEIAALRENAALPSGEEPVEAEVIEEARQPEASAEEGEEAEVGEEADAAEAAAQEPEEDGGRARTGRSARTARPGAARTSRSRRSDSPGGSGTSRASRTSRTSRTSDKGRRR